MEPLDTRAEVIAEMERGQSDHEDWLPWDHDFWQGETGEDDEDSCD